MSLHYVSAHTLQSGANNLPFILQHKTGMFKFWGANILHFINPILFSLSLRISNCLSLYSAVPVTVSEYDFNSITNSESPPSTITLSLKGKFKSIIDGYNEVKSKPRIQCVLVSILYL